MINQTAKLFIVAVLMLMPCIAFALPGAHDPVSGGKSLTCNSCHILGKNIGNRDATYDKNFCVTCHGSGVYLKTNKKFFTDDFANPFKTTAVAQSNNPVQSSHKWFGSDNVPAAGAQPPTDQRASGLNKTGYTGYLSCGRCHALHGTSGTDSVNRPYLRMANDTDQMCRDCHRSRDTKNHTLGTHPVNVIYSSAYKAKPTLFLQNPVTNATNPTGQVKLVKGLVVCSTCHGVHNTDSRTSTFDPFSSNHAFGQLSSSKGYLLRVDAYGKASNPDDVNICTNCHAGFKNHNRGLKGGTKYVQCNDCHSGHVEYDAAAAGIPAELVPNKYLVRRYLQYTTAGRLNKRIFYRYTGSSTKELYDRSGNGKGVCQSCHNPPTDNPTPVNNHYNGTNGTGGFPNAGHANCDSCHKHGEINGSFSYGTGSCATNSCHGLPPVLDTQNVAGGTASGYSKYLESTTPHASHSSGGANYYNHSCNQCHKGALTVMPAYNGIYDEVFINHTGAGIYAGYAANYIKASSTCSQVYCHSNGAGAWKGSNASMVWGSGKKDSIIGLAGATRCVICHDNTTIATGLHTKHVTAMGYVCVTCHYTTVSDNTTLLLSAKLVTGDHVNNVKDVVFNQVLPASGATCATIYCHSNGKGKAPVQLPVWTDLNSGKCGDCHKTKQFGNITTGGHKSAAHLSTADDTQCVRCHTFNGETLFPHVDGTVGVNFTGVVSCAINGCHGTPAPPIWTVSYAGKDTCTKCHGTLTNTGFITPAANNRYLVAPSVPAGTDTGNVSADPKTGAHQTHLSYLNGFSNYSTVDYRCQACHGTLPVSGTHSNGISTPEGAFRNIANNWGTMSPAPTYSGVTFKCANTYCHNPAAVTGGTLASGDFGTDITPSWNDSTYIDNGGKNQTNCGKCHKVPGSSGFTKQAAHGANVTDTLYICTGCHGHNGDMTGPLGQRHMDGKYYANGACDSCHGYPPVADMTGLGVSNNFLNAKIQTAGGGGHHTLHLLATVTALEGSTPCLPCHPDDVATHHNLTSTVATANVNVNDGTSSNLYRFDGTRTKRYNRAAKTCSNISCHFKLTPTW